MRVGVECEFEVHAADRRLDFRTEIAGVTGVPGQDPSDPLARRLDSGAALTADGWEAELATPPLPVGADVAERLDALLDVEAARLVAALGRRHDGVRIVGFSTHVNVSVPDAVAVRLAEEFTRSCALAAVLLLGGPRSSGVLVRPRRGRLEVCGDYVTGADLRVAVTFVAAATRMLLAGVRPADGPWPWVPARERFGYYVDGAVAAGCGAEAAAEVWGLARGFAVDAGLGPGEVDARVAGLSASAPGKAPELRADACGPVGPLAVADPRAHARVRGAVRAERVWATWTTAAWRLGDERGRTRYVVLPVDREEDLLARLDAGLLDRWLPFVVRAPRLRVLVASEQAGRPRVWRDVRPEGLVPAERRPDGSVPRPGSPPGGGDPDSAKNRADESRPPSGSLPAPRSWRPLLVGVGAAVLLAAGVGAGVALSDDGPDAPAPAPSGGTGSGSASPSPSTTPGVLGPGLWHYVGTYTEGDRPPRPMARVVSCTDVCDIQHGDVPPLPLTGGTHSTDVAPVDNCPAGYTFGSRQTVEFTPTTLVIVTTAYNDATTCQGVEMAPSEFVQRWELENRGPYELPTG